MLHICYNLREDLHLSNSKILLNSDTSTQRMCSIDGVKPDDGIECKLGKIFAYG